MNDELRKMLVQIKADEAANISNENRERFPEGTTLVYGESGQQAFTTE